MKILYISPHLSTGGAPQYLLKKIQLLKDEHEIYVIEYSDYGIFRVQKDKIIEILGDKLFTLDENKHKCLDIIEEINPDLIHFEEMPEFFMDDVLSSVIYRKNRTYKIFETSHDSSFDPASKRFFPDKFLFCSDNQLIRFRSIDTPACVVEYPTPIYQRPNREDGLRKLNLDPNFKHVLNVGLFTSRKNQGEIFEYARKFEDKNVLFHFVGNMAPNFKDYWDPLMNNKPQNCIIWGERNDVENFYSCMDLFLFTSKGNHFDKETNPLSLKEAISWQMPVLTYKLDSYQNKLDNKVTYLSEGEYSFEKNLLKICNELKIEGFIDLIIESRKPNEHDFNSGLKFTLWTHHFFDALNDKMIGLYETKTNLLIYRTNIFGPSIWFAPFANSMFLEGITVRIYDVLSKYFSTIEDTNLIDKHHLLFEKTFTDSNFNIDTKKAKTVHAISDDSSAWFTMYEVFIKEVYKDVDIREGDIVLDVGGHYGLFTKYALEKNASKVYVFEPTPKTFDVLSKNVGNDRRVKSFNLAMAEKDGEVEFISVGPSSVCSMYDNENNSEDNKNSGGVNKKIKVKTLSFDSFIKNNEVDRIDVFKLDCEGAETEIFPSITDDFLKYRMRKIVMEVHGFQDTSEKNIEFANYLINRLTTSGYQVTPKGDMMNGNLGELVARRIPKIKIVHMLVDVNGEREKQSIEHVKDLADYAKCDYIQMINGRYTQMPPKETCARPDDVQMEPGHYKLAPAHYGNYLAHRTAIEEHLNDDVDAVLFCECDAIFIKPIYEVYKQIIDRLDDLRENNLKYMSFGKRIQDWNHDEVNKHFGMTDRMSEAHCYLIPSSERNYFINKFENTGWDTYDLWLNNFVLNEKIGGITSKPFSIQCSGESYLDQSHKDGTTLLNEGDITYVK